MLIHVFDDTPHHYQPMQVFFSKQCQIEQQQQFWARQPKKNNLNNNNNAISFYASDRDLIRRLKQLPSSAKIVFHGLFELHIWRRLLLLNIAKNCSCVFWGAELYRHGKADRQFKHYIAQVIHGLLISRFQAVTCLNTGDAKLVGEYLKRKDASVLPYPLIGFTVNDDSEVEAVTSPEKNHNRAIKILLGNSAAASNEHSYALKQLSHLANDNIKIIAPLNYGGNENYVASVIAQGKAIFADKFIAYTKMLDKTAYDKLLQEVDLAVFAHNRQQGLYVAYAMLCQGKPMYLKQQTSSFSSLSELGFFIQPTEQLDRHSFANIQQQVSQLDHNNKTLMNNLFTEAALAPKWSDFLNGLFD